MDRRWITILEAAQYLSIHPVTCRRLLDRNKIPGTRFGRNIRVDLKKLTEQLERESRKQ